MAKKGIEYAVFGLWQEGGTYTGGKWLSPVAGLTGTPTKSNVKDYGDNRVVETDNSVTGGTLNLELNNDADEIYTFLLGHKKGQQEKGVVYNVNDVAPFVGVGAVGQSEGGYVAMFYKKVQFSEPNDENSTKQENTTFNHITLEGEIIIPEDGEWKLRERFDTLQEAKGWLNEKVGIKGGMISSDTLVIPAQSQSLLGKKISELISAETCVLKDGSVAGTLHNVSGYEDFSDDPAEQSGHYLPITFGSGYSGKQITIKGRTDGDRTVTLDEDLTLVLRKENLTGDTAEIESEGEPVVTLDFSTAVLEE